MINRTTDEDLVILELLTSKLEECYNSLGYAFFATSVNKEKLNSIIHRDIFDESEYDDDPTHSTAGSLKPGPVKRTRIRFHSKGDLKDRFFGDHSGVVFGENDEKSASAISIEWDYITNVFEISVSHDTYEINQYTTAKSSNKSGTQWSRLPGSPAALSLNFLYKNRYDIKMIKIRLGKLFKKVKRDNLMILEETQRKHLSEVTMAAFPDLFDSLILGVKPNEKRDDRGVPS